MRARSGHAPLSYCPEEEDDREGAGGLGRIVAGRPGWTGRRQVGLLLSFILSILFLFFNNSFATEFKFKQI